MKPAAGRRKINRLLLFARSHRSLHSASAAEISVLEHFLACRVERPVVALLVWSAARDFVEALVE